MVRDKRSAAASSGATGEKMTDREEALRRLGVEVRSEDVGPNLDALSLEPNGFSGYGEFTPITIRSYSLPDDADLERDKPRN